jgi:hypothetical protein
MMATGLAAVRLALRSAPLLIVGQLLVAVATTALPVLTAWLTKLVIDALVGGLREWTFWNHVRTGSRWSPPHSSRSHSSSPSRSRWAYGRCVAVAAGDRRRR